MQGDAQRALQRRELRLSSTRNSAGLISHRPSFVRVPVGSGASHGFSPGGGQASGIDPCPGIGPCRCVSPPNASAWTGEFLRPRAAGGSCRAEPSGMMRRASALRPGGTRNTGHNAYGRLDMSRQGRGRWRIRFTRCLPGRRCGRDTIGAIGELGLHIKNRRLGRRCTGQTVRLRP